LVVSFVLVVSGKAVLLFVGMVVVVLSVVIIGVECSVESRREFAVVFAIDETLV